VALGVASEIVTLCTEEYVPEAREKIGVDGVVVRPKMYVADATLLLR
jgi:hypothetical protein